MESSRINSDGAIVARSKLDRGRIALVQPEPTTAWYRAMTDAPGRGRSLEPRAWLRKAAVANLFRGMRADGEYPAIGPTARTLGVRAGIDIPVVADSVDPGQGGLSVAPDDALRLPRFRRPREIGGTGKDPVFSIDLDFLGSDLVYRPDPADPEVHGFIEPARRMTFDEYQRALTATRAAWRRYRP